MAACKRDAEIIARKNTKTMHGEYCMNFEKFYSCDNNERPLDNIVTDGGYCSIFNSITFVGDSLLSGEFDFTRDDGERGLCDIASYSWGKILAKMAGIEKVYVYSQGGMTTGGYHSFADEKGYWNKDNATQCYVIALGCNDFSQNVPLGSAEDIDLNDYNKNKVSIIGNYAKIIQRYKEIQPKAKFFLVSMPKDELRGVERSEKLYEALKLLVDIFDNTYMIDLYNYAFTYDEEFRAIFSMGGHMNPAGYVLTAKIIASYIDYIIRHNMDDFRQVCFIGTSLCNKNYK